MHRYIHISTHTHSLIPSINVHGNSPPPPTGRTPCSFPADMSRLTRTQFCGVGAHQQTGTQWDGKTSSYTCQSESYWSYGRLANIKPHHITISSHLISQHNTPRQLITSIRTPVNGEREGKPSPPPCYLLLAFPKASRIGDDCSRRSSMLSRDEPTAEARPTT